MTPISTIDRSTLDALGTAFARELKALGDRFGIDISPAGGVYGGLTGEVRLAVSVRQTLNGVSGAEEEWNLFCGRYGLLPSDFGKTFYHQGVGYKVTGITPSRPKYPVDAQRIADGRPFKFWPSAVKARQGIFR